MELVFVDVSTFDAENSIVGSLIREIDLNKKQTDSDFIKSLSSQPGKEFEIKKRLNRLSDIKNPSRKNNNNGGNLFSPGPGGDGIHIPQDPDQTLDQDHVFLPRLLALPNFCRP